MSHLPDARWRVGLPAHDGITGHALLHFRQSFLESAKGILCWPLAGLAEKLGDSLLDIQGLGWLDGEPVFLYELAEAPLSEDNAVSLRSFLTESQPDIFRMLSYASQIGVWSREHRYCGSCGLAMQSSSEHRMRFCTACGVQQYPRISPCMIVLVTRGDEVLLGRAPRFVPGMYSCLAGFTEPGETMEGCVHREVYEETKVRVHNLRYIASQNWPFPHSMMIGFHAEYLSGEIIPQLDEIEDARWFSIDDLPMLPMQGSIARYLIDSYLHERGRLAAPAPPA